MIINEPTKADKIIPMVFGGFFLVFLAFLPAMYNDAQKAKEQLWQENGCRMYDGLKVSEVPAKCHDDFVENYAPQTPQRSQPNQQGAVD